MRMHIGAGGAALALACLTGCKDQGPAARVWRLGPASVLAHMQLAGFSGLEHAVVADSVTWAARWAQITSDGPQPIPAIDFTAERVLVAAFGLHATGGYDITIDSAVDYYDSTVVHVTLTLPAPGCSPPRGLTSPAYAVRVPIPPEPVTFQDRQVLSCDSLVVLGYSLTAGFADSVRAVVSDTLTWASVWKQFGGANPLPQIDFAQNRVLLVALGTRPTGGYGIRVDSLAYLGGTVVHVSTIAPGPTCPTTQGLTSPAELVRVPQLPEPIVFQDHAVVTDCR